MIFRVKSHIPAILFAACALTRAETLEGLVSSGELEARVVVTTPEPHLQKAPIILSVEIGTSRWFKRGTRVRDFTVNGALTRPVSSFALNETRRRNGDSWTFQSWRFRLYASEEGALRLPPFKTFISVDTEDHGVVEGEIELAAPSLKIIAPAGTEDLPSWIAATAFSIDESWEGLLDEYQVGDAVTRVRRFSITGTPAMTIPASPPPEIAGVNVYQAPARVNDQSARGALQGEREERVVFTFENRGTFTIPEHSAYWFNLSTEAVEHVELPSRAFTVEGRTGPTNDQNDRKDHLSRELPYWIGGAALVLLSLAASRLFRASRIHQPLRTFVERVRKERRAKKEFMRAAAIGASPRCIALIYQRFADHPKLSLDSTRENDATFNVLFAATMAHAYGDGPTPSKEELKRLWKIRGSSKKRREPRDDLKLNPKPSA